MKKKAKKRISGGRKPARSPGLRISHPGRAKGVRPARSPEQAKKLLATLQTDLRSFETTHPHLVRTINELARELASLGI